MVVMELLAVLTVMSLTLFSGVTSLGLRLANEDESIVLQLTDLLPPEITDLRLRFGTVAVVLSHLLNGLLSVLGLVLAALSVIVTLSALPVALVLSSSSAGVVVPSLLVLTAFVLSWLLLLHLGLHQWSRMFLHCHLGCLLHLFRDHNRSWGLDLRLGHCHHNWSLSNRCGNRLLLHDLLDRLRLHFNLLLKHIAHNLLLIADNGGNLGVSVLLNIGSKGFLKFLIVGEILESSGKGGN